MRKESTGRPKTGRNPKPVFQLRMPQELYDWISSQVYCSAAEYVRILIERDMEKTNVTTRHVKKDCESRMNG